MKSLKKFAAAMPAGGGASMGAPALPPSSMGGLPAGGQNPAQQKVQEQQAAAQEAQAAAPDANPQIMAANQAAEQASMEAQQQMAQIQAETGNQMAAMQQETSNQLAMQQQAHAEELALKDKEIRSKDIDIQLAKAEAKLADKSKDLDIKGMSTDQNKISERVDNIVGRLQKAAAMDKQIPAESKLLPSGTLSRINSGEPTRFTNNKAYMPFQTSRVSYGMLGDLLYNSLGKNMIYKPSNRYMEYLGGSAPSLRPGQQLKHMGMQALSQLR